MARTQIAEIRHNLYESRRDTLALVRHVEAEVAVSRPRPNAWCIKDHIAHLVAVEESIIHFAHRILNEDCPISPLCYDVAFNQDAWNHRGVTDRAGYTWTEAVCALEQTRLDLLGLLERIEDETLSRIGSHPIWGDPVTLASILRIPYRHERGHRDEMMALYNALNHR